MPAEISANRCRGALLGLAVGDAVGTTAEFAGPGTFAPIRDMVGGGPFGLAPGQWTDDTSMALCLAESLVETGGFDPVDQLQRYVRWWKEGHLSSTGRCFDIGNQTREALERFVRTGAPYCGQPDPKKAGNGSLMRLAPVPIKYADQPLEAIERAAQSSRTTHAAQVAVDACRYLAALMVGALRGEHKRTLLAPGYCPVPSLWEASPLHPEVAEVVAGRFKSDTPPPLGRDRYGYTVKALEVALWAFHLTDEFKSGCLLVANLGGDADTTTAIYAQLAGAYYGADAIPRPWLDKLALRERIEELAVQLAGTRTDRLAPALGGAHTSAEDKSSEACSAPATGVEESPGLFRLAIPASLEERRRLGELVRNLEAFSVPSTGRGLADLNEGSVLLALERIRLMVEDRPNDIAAYLTGAISTLEPYDPDEPNTHQRLCELSCAVRTFDYMADPRYPHWMRQLELLSRDGGNSPLEGWTQDLWDWMLVIQRHDYWGDAEFIPEHIVAVCRIGNEIRRRLLGEQD